jgi:hypothetical protein
MEKKSTKARQKTSQEETGVSTRAAKKRNTTIATDGKDQKRAKLARTKKSATKEHGGDEYSPENVVQEGGRIYSSTDEACGAAAAAASRNNYDSAASGFVQWGKCLIYSDDNGLLDEDDEDEEGLLLHTTTIRTTMTKSWTMHVMLLLPATFM